MDIFSEIKTKILRPVRGYLLSSQEKPRPQDDVPDERVLKYIVGDYRRMFIERTALIAYIREMECIYKDMQTEVFRIVGGGGRSVGKKNRMVQDLRQMLYNNTKKHMEQQELLRRKIESGRTAGKNGKQKEEANYESNRT